MDVLPLDKRKNYVGVLKNGVQSERYRFLFCVFFWGSRGNNYKSKSNGMSRQ